MEGLKPDQRQMTFDMGLSNGATSFFNPFVNLFNFGTLERHPKLRFCLAESGTGWIPFVVQEWTTATAGNSRGKRLRTSH
jgi:hypothetical protein